MRPRPNEGDIAIFCVNGRDTECEILKVYVFGTADIKRLSDGECFRVTGLGWI